MIVDVKYLELFPVLIQRVVLDLDHEAITKHTLEHRDKYWKRYTNYHDPEINKDWRKDLPDREKMEQAFIKAGEEFVKHTKRKEFKDGVFIDYWASVYDEGDQHGSHNHPNSLIAGTYYPSIGKESVPIQHEAPYDSFCMHDSQHPNERIHTYNPNAGDMLLWPSWLYHRVPIQKTSDARRIAISFNLDYAKYHD